MTTRSDPIRFGPFSFDPLTRALSRTGQPVRLGGRAADLLGALLERPGEVLSRSELERKVWPTVVVEETSLRVHISAIRRALCEREDNTRYIANVPGRGYAFIGTITDGARPLALAIHAQDSTQTSHNLPPLLTDPIGRDNVIAALRQALIEQRLVSITGAGGMGKTTVAVATARGLIKDFPHGVRFVDLTSVSDSERVAPAVADAFGLALPAIGAIDTLVDLLRDRNALIVLDNCEQVIEGAAEVVHRVISGTPHIRILATSRESLNVPGERIHSLAPLGLPGGESVDEDPAPSVQLFVQRATAIDDNFILDAVTTPLVHRLCRQLDGMPLAIELAAGRIDMLGIQGLVDQLHDMFRVLARGRRTAALRHQALQALLDWSHDLLGEVDQKVLRRIAVFPGAFTLDAAVQVCAFESIDATAATDSLIGLVSKSLVSLDRGVGSTGFRLLVTTRTYALAKLQASGEWDAVSCRHARVVQTALEATNKEMEQLSLDEIQHRRAHYAALMDDLRGALDWALSPLGDPRLGVSIVLASDKVILLLCLMDEFLPRMETALLRVQSLDPPDLMLEFRTLCTLCRAAGVSPDYGTRNPGVFSRLRELVEQVADRDHRIPALQSLITQAMGSGDYIGVADLARQIMQTASGPHEPAAIFLGERLLAQSHHGMGRHAEALEIVHRILSYPTRKAHAQYVGNVPVAVSYGVLRARIAWMLGDVDDAASIMDDCVSLARGLVPFVLGHALALGAIPVRLWRGDEEAASLLVSELRELAKANGLHYWTSWAQMCELAIAVRKGRMLEDAAQMHKLTTRESDMVGTLAERLVTQQAMLRVQSGQVGWSIAETVRCTTERHLRNGTISWEAADLAFQQATDVARTQNALSWKLRVAISRARLWLIQGRREEAQALVMQTLSLFTQGHSTRDQVLARNLLEEISLDRSLLHRAA